MAEGISRAPCGPIIDRIEPEADALIIVARPGSDFAICPTCGQHSNSIHSRYQRIHSVKTAEVRAAPFPLSYPPLCSTRHGA